MLNEVCFSSRLRERAKQVWRALPPNVKQRITHAVHPARVAMVKRVLARHDAEDKGVVSVVVPIYNVDPFLDECLSSIVRQTYPFLEVILVDDGSSDNSYSIARGYERADGRVKLIRKTNAGLGAARNTGLANATGKFVAFVDSDDILPVNAYKTMVDSLHDSRSDFAIGSFRRFSSKRRWLPPIPARVHSEDRIGVTIDECSDVLYDVFAWNKLFVRNFWHSEVGAFPEGVLYEDKEPMVAAYLRANAFDVLHAVVYEWRIREDGSSITQQKHSLNDLQNRMRVAAGVNRLMEQSASEPVRQVMAQVVFGLDLGVYYAQVPRTDERYWQTLQEGVSALAALIDVKTMSTVPLHARILTELVVSGARDDLEIVLVDQQVNGKKYTIVRDGDQFRGKPAYLQELRTSIRPETLLLTQADFETNTALTGYSWSSNSVLNVQGYAYISGFDLDAHSTEIRVGLLDSRNGQVVDVPTECLPRDSRIDEDSGDPWSTYANSGFSAHIDTTALLVNHGYEADDAEWRVVVSVTTAGITVRSHLQKRDTRGSAGTFQTGSLIAGARIVGAFRPGVGLLLAKEKAEFAVSDWNVTGRTLNLKVKVVGTNAPRRLHIDCRQSGRHVVVGPTGSGPDGTVRFSVKIPAGMHRNPNEERMWRVRIDTADGQAFPVAWSDTSATVSSAIGILAGVQASVTQNGNLQVRDRAWRMSVIDIDIVKSVLRLHCSVASISGAEKFNTPRLVLASDNELVEPLSVEWNATTGELVADFPIDSGGAWNADGPPVAGLYTLRCVTAQDGSLTDSYWIPLDTQLLATLPTDVLLESSRIRLSRTPRAAALAVQYSAPLEISERGARHQRILRESIDISQARESMKDAVLFQSFFGATVSDSGKALFEEMRRRAPHIKLYWAVRDYSISVPEGATPVLVSSREWYEVLAGAAVLVNNGNFPEYFRKQPHQFYLQTWHGTPLKKIGKDVPARSLSLSYKRLMKREAENYWNVLLAQSDYAAEVLAHAFNYAGPVLTTGYPRNDRLAGKPNQGELLAIKRRLGIDPSKKVLLYAPTWRDNVKVGNRYDLVNYLDFEEAHKRLGDEYVFLLRGHQNIAAQRSTLTQKSYVDVTTYPDINDLFRITDVLVTDYSSVMFDFCVTQKRMIFLAPDLANFRDSVRGFYLDFEEVAPGPIVSDTAGVVEALANEYMNTTTYATKYEEFIRRFAPYDDGRATQRALDQIFQMVGNSPAIKL